MSVLSIPTVVIGWPEGLLCHRPSGGENHEVAQRHSGLRCGARQNGEDAGILGMNVSNVAKHFNVSHIVSFLPRGQKRLY